MEDIRQSYRGKVVAVIGPPHSGKSIFIAELFLQLLSLRPTSVFLQRANPDGEGMWFVESSPEVAEALRRKGQYSEEFMKFISNAIGQLGKTFPLVLLDVGGRQDEKSASILSMATHVILLAPDQSVEDSWLEFGISQRCLAMAIFASRLVRRSNGVLDDTVRSTVNLSLSPIKGVLYNLDRGGSKEPYREVIHSLANWLAEEQMFWPEVA